ncbi:MAG: histidine kinase [Chitinophagaceae bacterium]|nr:histidine kinase [Chitinophagaceae bacterium]
MASLQQKLFRNVTTGELLGWLLYVLIWSTFNLWDAATKIIFTIPVWWLFFVLLHQVSLKYKLLLHLITLPAFCYTCLLVKQSNPGLFNNQHSSIWDLYSTALFYFSEFAIFHGYSYRQQLDRRHIREQELLELNYQTEINALKAQIEPHFLFNTLNSISASVPPAMEETRVLIAQLADTFRYALKVSEKPLVSLEEELVFVRNWLGLEKQRFGKRLELIYDIDASTLRAPVPPMILQPLLENALAHGISPMVNGGAVTVSCKQEGKDVRISITDTGAGFDGPLETIFNRGLGLNNTSRRLEKLFGEPLIICRNPHGMCFSFRIPLSFLPSSRQMIQLPDAERSAW